MLCLARSILSNRAGFQILTRRPLPTTINWLTPLVRISNYADIRNPQISRPELRDKKLNRKAQKKALRTERREKEKEEAKIPGSPAAIKAELKARKIAKKLERRARAASKEAPTEEVQWRRDREALSKKQAEPTTRQDRQEFKQRKKSTEELPAPTGTDNRIPRHESRNDKGWGSSWSPMDTDAVSSKEEAPRKRTTASQTFDYGRGERTRAALFSHSDRRKDGQIDGANERPWQNRTKDGSNSSTRPDRPRPNRRIDNTRVNENTQFTRPDRTRDTIDRKSDRTERPRRSDDRGDRSATPFASKSKSDEPYEKSKREQWMIQKEAIKKKFGDEAWAPKKRLSPDTLEAIRTMHTSDPDKFATPLLAEQFKVSPEVIRRILRTKWQPDEATVQDRQERWARRGERIWTKQAELGVRPPKKWREMGVANTGEAGVAPKWKKNAHTRDKYGEQPKHFVAQRRGASSGSVDIGYKKPFSERIL